MPIRRHTRASAPRDPASPRGRSAAGPWLFLLGVLVGAVGTHLAEERPRRPSSEVDARASNDANDGPDAAAGARAAEQERHGGRRDAAGRRRFDASGPSIGAEPASSSATAELASAAARPAAAGPPGPAAGPARIALVIDDLGRSLEDLDSLHRLGVPLTYAVLPFEPQTAEVAAALRRNGDEILCHLPMEPKSGGNPGPGALRTGMSQEQLRLSTLAAIAAVPGAVGVNNHMGSGLSADPASMAAILGVLAARHLFFLDSRTSAQSVGYQVAASLGVPAAERQVFLDDDLHPDAIAGEFQRLLELARARGEAIAIGHPHPATLAILTAEVPRAQAQGFRFVPVSSLLDRPAAPPRAPDGR